MNDLIRRSDAISAVTHAWAKGFEPSQYIENIPAVDAVEVVHAEWVKRPTSGRFPTFECSSCHGYTGGEEVVKTCHYCPNCGARMDGRREEEQNEAD